MIKLIVCGSRNFYNKELAFFTLDSILLSINRQIIITSGGAEGADHLGELYAKKLSIPLEIYKADWNKHGKAAGPIRNEEMAKVATHCLAFHMNNSRGTKNMIDLALQYGLWTKVINV